MTDEAEDAPGSPVDTTADPADGAGPEPADDGEPRKAKPTKAERLEAKAARLRDAEQERAARAAAAAEAGVSAERPRRYVVALVAAAILIIALTAALVVSLLHSDTGSAGKPAPGRSAVAAAKVYAVEFGSYDYRHLDADFAKVAARLTPQFKKSYLQSSTRLKPAIEQVQGVAVGTVRAAGLVSATATTAVVAIFLDQKVTTSRSKTPRIDRNRLLVTMERSGGTWLISKLTSP